MRKVFRNADTLTYWNKRWNDLEYDNQKFQNKDIYPLKFTDMVMSKGKKSLDAGCGLGRLVRHYHNEGHQIFGCDYSQIAIDKLKKSNPELEICYGNLIDLPYDDDEFDNIFVMGGFHSIENLSDLDKAVKETVRCLKVGGYLVAEARADTLENWLIDYISELRGAKGNNFHKWCFKEDEIIRILKKQPLDIERCEYITNYPFLYKFQIFREMKKSKESFDRSHGYVLNWLGNKFNNFCKIILPGSFFTHYIFTMRKSVDMHDLRLNSDQL